jgi:lysophospholipase L1-like esterase
MSVLHSVRTRLLVCCVASIAALGALVLAPSAGAAKIGNTYLALGDSLAYGYHAAQFKEELAKGEGTCIAAGICIKPASFNDGYVDDFGAALKFANPKLQIINDGCPGETTDAFIKGSGIPGFCSNFPANTPFPDVWLHHPYTGSQLEDALAILKANPNVSPITLDIGSNDVLQACPITVPCGQVQVEALFGHIAANVGYILAQLRAAAPKAQIVLIGSYNPYPTVLPPPGGDKTLAALNALLASVAAKVTGASFANSEPPFNPSIITGGPETQDLPTICAFTAMCPGGTFNPLSKEADIHPTKLGYAVMAGVVTVGFLTH